MLHRSLHLDGVRPFALFTHISLTVSFKILKCKRFFLRRQVLCLAYPSLVDDLASIYSCLRTYVYEQVCCPHYLLIVFHDNNGVTQVTQPLQHRDKTFCITRMQSDARLIQNVKGAYKRTA